MGIRTRFNKAHILDSQPPRYSEYWQCNEIVAVPDSEGTKKKSTPPSYRPRSADAGPRPLVDDKVSLYHDFDVQQDSYAESPQEEGTIATNESQSTWHTHCRSRDKNGSQQSRCGKDWIRSLKRKHSRKHNKSSDTSTPPVGPRFVAIAVPTNPPRVTNKVLLDQDTISLCQSNRNSGAGQPSFKVTLATTLLENRPYTICSNVLQRNQTLEAALAHFEVFDVENGHVLSENPLPSQPIRAERATGRKIYGDHKSKRVCRYVSRRACTELHPNRTSLLTILLDPSPSKFSTERLFNGLRISDPPTLIGRRLGLRLRPETALWSARTMEKVFGFDEVLVGGWPDGYYGRLLDMRCSDIDGQSGWAEFRVIE